MEYLPLLMLAPLTRLIVSDFRHREVPLLWLVILAVGTVCIPLLREGWPEVLLRIGHNLLLIMYMSGGTVLWAWFKSKKIVNPLNLYIGVGDLIFFVILIPLYPLLRYACLLVGCMLFSLIWWWVATVLKKSPKNIPLIGTSGIVVAGAIVVDILMK